MFQLYTELRRRKLAHELTDAELLQRFLAGEDRAAFEALVYRHGPMVLGVCRRHLRDPATVDDAVQATFLVLLRSARKIRRADSLGSWLHGVAVRTAQAAVRLGMNRRHHESSYARQRTATLQEPDQTPAQELGPWLDEELRRLPERLRQPLVLCYLEGLTKAQAARRLGLPEGTVSSRLSRGRELLRSRLVRRGLPSAVVLAAFVPASLASAALPPPLLQGVVSLALSFTSAAGVTAPLLSPLVTSLGDQVMTAMALAKLKFVSFLVAVGLAAGAGGTFAWQSGAGAAPAPGKANKAPAVQPTSSNASNAASEVSPDSSLTVREVRQRLAERTDKFRNGLDPLSAEDHLHFIEKAFNLTFSFDRNSFAPDVELKELKAKEVRLEKHASISLGTALDKILDQLEPPATYVVRGDHIAIVSKEAVENGYLLRTKTSFDVPEGQTLSKVLRQLAEQNGVTILLDSRCKSKGQTQVEGNFQNVTLDVAVRLLAEMAGLKAVTVGNVLFVTEAEFAFQLQQEVDGQLLPPAALGGMQNQVSPGGAGIGGGSGGVSGPSSPKPAATKPGTAPSVQDSESKP